MTVVHRSGVFILSLGLFLALVPKAHSMDPERLLREKEQERQAVEIARTALSTSKAREKCSLNKNLDARKKKKETITQYKNALSSSFIQKMNQLSQKKVTTKRESEAVYQATQRYLSEVDELTPLFESLKNQFVSHKNDEDYLREVMGTGLNNLHETTHPNEFNLPMFTLRNTIEREQASFISIQSQIAQLTTRIGSAHSRYLSKIRPYEDFIDQNRIPRPEISRETMDSLTHMKGYAEQRIAISESIPGKIRKLNKQREDLIQRIEAQDSLKIETQFDKHKQTISLMEEAYALTARELEVGKQIKEQLPSLKLKLLLPYYEYYQEVIAYRGFCSGILSTRNKNSTHYEACLFLRALFDTADQFYKIEARNKVLVTLKSAQKKAPQELSDLVKDLENSLNRVTPGEAGDQSTVRSLITIHDRLLLEWNRLNLRLQNSERDHRGQK